MSQYRVLIVISLHFIQKPIHKHHMLKSQITSTPPERRRASKLQTNYKFQCPMTKTVDMFVFRYPEHVWDFEFRSRAAQALAPRVVIYLEFVIWNLEFSR